MNSLLIPTEMGVLILAMVAFVIPLGALAVGVVIRISRSRVNPQLPPNHYPGYPPASGGLPNGAHSAQGFPPCPGAPQQPGYPPPGRPGQAPQNGYPPAPQGPYPQIQYPQSQYPQGPAPSGEQPPSQSGPGHPNR